MIRETCSCGATTKIDIRVAAGLITETAHDKEQEAIASWRATHRHEPPAPHEHNWVSWGTVTEPATTETCGTCGATRDIEPECDHLWDRGTADFPTLGKCAKCGVPEPIEATFTVPTAGEKLVFHPENADGYIRCYVVPSHEHDWVPSPKDFYGPPRCRVCGMSDVTLGVPPDGVPSTDPAGGS